MLAPTHHILHDHSPPGAVSLAVAVVTGGLVGLVFIPLAAIGLALGLVLVTLRRAWLGALRSIGLTPSHGVLAELGADRERQRP